MRTANHYELRLPAPTNAFSAAIRESVKIGMITVLLLILSGASHAEPIWQFETGGMIAGNAVLHQQTVLVAGGSQLFALDRQGKSRWAYDAGAATFSTPSALGDVVFLLADNGLHAVGPGGKRLWLFESTDAPLEVEGTSMGWGEGRFVDPWAWYRSAPLVVNGSVVFGNRHGTFAVDAKSGAQRWQADTGTTHTKPALHEGLVVVGSWDNHLYGLNIDDGSVAWKVRSRLPEGEMSGWLGWEGFNLDPVIHEGVVYVGNRGTYFYAIDAGTGMEKWSAKHPTSWVGSPAAISDDVIYFGMSDGYSLLGLETRMGNQSLLFRNRFYNFARPQASGTHVFLASLSGELFAVEKSTGKGRKIFATASSQANLSELQNPDGGLEFLYSKEGYTHENATRDVQRMLSKLDSLLSLTLEGDTLYAGSANGILYAIRAK
jgi:outer membrane protein assembly factor BamB